MKYVIPLLSALSLLGNARGDDVSRWVVTPGQIIESNQEVEARVLMAPFAPVAAMPALSRDHVGPVKVFHALVDQRTQDSYPLEPGLGLGFSSVSGAASAGTPPDCGMSAGPTNVMVVTNTSFRIYDKAGTQQFSSSPSSFFSSVVPSGLSFYSDPRVVYDAQSQRWFIVMLGLKGSSSITQSWFMVAVSATSDANGTWKKYAVDGTGSSGTWTDFPCVGFSDTALVVCGNQYTTSGQSFAYDRARIFDKSQLTNFATTLTFNDITSITDASGAASFTIQPATSIGSAPLPIMFDNQPGTRVNVFAINNPLTSPTLTKKGLTVTSFSAPSTNASQNGSSVTIDTSDNRTPSSPQLRNGKLYAAWAINGGSGAASRWMQIDVSGGVAAATLSQQNTISASGKWYSYPAIASNSNGSVVMGMCRWSATTEPSAEYVYRYSLDANNTMSATQIIKEGTRPYSGEGGAGVRWGDFGSTVVDPADDMTFWDFHECSSLTGTGATTTWSTWLQAITIPRMDALSITSSTPVTITVSPSDYKSLGSGTTPLARNYIEGTPITLTAPATAGSFTFSHWELNGVSQGPSTTLSFSATGDENANAVYVQSRNVSVTSSPNSVTVTASPADLTGSTGGSTPLALAYQDGTPVTLSAPVTDGFDQNFLNWTINGTDQPQQQNSVTFTVTGSDFTAVANYGCPADLNGDGFVDFFDFSDFIDCFQGNGCPDGKSADFNGDGFVDFFDFSDFINAFEAGC